MITFAHGQDNHDVETLVPRIQSAVAGCPYDDILSSLLAVAIDIAVDGDIENVQFAKRLLHNSLDQILLKHVNQIIHKKQG